MPPYLRGLIQYLRMIDYNNAMHYLRRAILALEVALEVIDAVGEVGQALRAVVRELRSLEENLPRLRNRLGGRRQLRSSRRLGPPIE